MMGHKDCGDPMCGQFDDPVTGKCRPCDMSVATASKPSNPKQAFGDKKPRLMLTPLSAQLAQFEAQLDGALKYGEVNWRKNPVEAKTYIDAALRHLRLYESGEDHARDTAVLNLGAVMSCCAILIDSELHGTLIDNRDHSPQTCDLLHGRGEYMVQHLQDMQRTREKNKQDASNQNKGRATSRSV